MCDNTLENATIIKQDNKAPESRESVNPWNKVEGFTKKFQAQNLKHLQSSTPPHHKKKKIHSI